MRGTTGGAQPLLAPVRRAPQRGGVARLRRDRAQLAKLGDETVSIFVEVATEGGGHWSAGGRRPRKPEPKAEVTFGNSSLGRVFPSLDAGRSLGDLNYLGAFLLTFVANATIVVPIPYLPIVGQIAVAAPSALPVVLLAALGSALGESTGFFLGRAGEGVASGSRVYRWMHRFAERPLASGLLLFVLAAPLNPLFDVAGIAAGALGLRYRVFLIATFLGRVLRFAVLAMVMLRVAGG